MNESQPHDPAPAPPTRPAPAAGSWKYTVAFVVLLLAAAGGWYAYVVSTTPEPPPPDELVGLKAYLTNLSQARSLKDGFADADGDLVADAPKDPARFLKVDEVGFTAVATDDPADLADAQARWKDLVAALEKATGKKVKYVAEIGSVDDQVRALADGRLHVTAFNTGQVSAAVNTAGFVPLFCPADKDGRYAYEMEVLVRPDSPVRGLEDLRGKTVGLVALSSNSGGKAPLVALKDKGLLPGRDYKYAITGGHDRSVQDLLAGRHDAVCVASDLLARAAAAGRVRPDQYRTVHKAGPFPPLCFGVPYNLPKELRDQVETVFGGFARDGAGGKFARVDYKADWKMVRDVDESLSRLLDGR